MADGWRRHDEHMSPATGHQLRSDWRPVSVSYGSSMGPGPAGDHLGGAELELNDSTVLAGLAYNDAKFPRRVPRWGAAGCRLRRVPDMVLPDAEFSFVCRGETKAVAAGD
ncbi:hypothetical protein B0H16DRAFT_1467480 [Mycena metata]|uniref:Uncharacterized protein n=1 Tax=Mycena metata TaxID=1033252 RepID=A0AAD7I473_9AGAR|nr:hypothetical protein B0H16DRAFT_1467480 [Mycena metata]